VVLHSVANTVVVRHQVALDGLLGGATEAQHVHVELDEPATVVEDQRAPDLLLAAVGQDRWFDDRLLSLGRWVGGSGILGGHRRRARHAGPGVGHRVLTRGQEAASVQPPLLGPAVGGDEIDQALAVAVVPGAEKVVEHLLGRTLGRVRLIAANGCQPARWMTGVGHGCEGRVGVTVTASRSRRAPTAAQRRDAAVGVLARPRHLPIGHFRASLRWGGAARRATWVGEIVLGRRCRRGGVGE
jgi:hypothetical protein